MIKCPARDREIFLNLVQPGLSNKSDMLICPLFECRMALNSSWTCGGAQFRVRLHVNHGQGTRVQLPLLHAAQRRDSKSPLGAIIREQEQEPGPELNEFPYWTSLIRLDTITSRINSNNKQSTTRMTTVDERIVVYLFSERQTPLGPSKVQRRQADTLLFKSSVLGQCYYSRATTTLLKKYINKWKYNSILDLRLRNAVIAMENHLNCRGSVPSMGWWWMKAPMHVCWPFPLVEDREQQIEVVSDTGKWVS